MSDLVPKHSAFPPWGPRRDYLVRDQFGEGRRAEAPHLGAASGAEGSLTSGDQWDPGERNVGSREQLLAILRGNRAGGGAMALPSMRTEVRPRSPSHAQPTRQVRPRLREQPNDMQPTQCPEPAPPSRDSMGWVYSAATEQTAAVSDRAAVHSALAMINSSVDFVAMNDAHLEVRAAGPVCGAAAPRDTDPRLRTIQRLGTGEAAELVHVAGSAARSTDQPPTAAAEARSADIAATGCSVDPAEDFIDARPVRQSVPAGARSSTVLSPSVTAGSGLIRRRLVGKQRPDDKPRREAAGIAKDPGRGTATADAAPAEPAPAAPREDEPPPTRLP